MTKCKSNVFRAVYFSRLPIPHGSKDYYEHIGIYGYKPKMLKNFISMKSSKLECNEKLEQLRALENSMKIHVGFTKSSPLSVDTKNDLIRVRNIMEKNE